MGRSPRFNGYLFIFFGTLFLFLAIQSAGQSSGWDVITIVLIAFAAFDYFLGFKFFVAAARMEQNKRGK
ncbi:YdiK family protein [Alkalicoccus urumqiensis]|uniref:DUF4305 domain-containing protein n=1 Tax=Alkalicoccus urumqiensis TaxID=1548213 RepID=A0A2P6MJB3_ALKUR|nr:YdiK family protein [Alkalicoccus urumqiensis]PRO66361.1 DUF4305 domain-containing protein [Alkalicoccus urumqiensis]